MKSVSFKVHDQVLGESGLCSERVRNFIIRKKAGFWVGKTNVGFTNNALFSAFAYRMR